MVFKRLGPVVLLALFLGWPLLALAQTDEPATPTPLPTASPAAEPAQPTATPLPAPARPPTHTIAAGETLVTIAAQYSVTVEGLQLVNGITDPELIFAGQELVIPGELGDEVPAVYVVGAADTLSSVAARFNTSAAAIAQANRLVNADFPYAGLRLNLISRTGTPNPLPITGRPYVAAPGETISEIALRSGVTMEALREANNLSGGGVIFPGQRLRLPDDTTPYQPGLPGEWVSVELSPAAPRQGDPAAVTIAHATPGEPAGRLIDPAGREIPLRFFPLDDGRFRAYVGFDAFAPTGRYRLQLEGSGPARPWFAVERSLVVSDFDYGLQAIVLDSSFAPLLDPQIRAAEDGYLETVFMTSTAEPLWIGSFQQPVTNTLTTAAYGSDRTYNGSEVIAFHTGIDFGGSVGTPILAPAAGRVVLIETLELRGLTMVVDHGGGIMSAYYHLSDTTAAVGEAVTPGQQIAAGGNSGLSTGPHLHWDVRIWGAAVDPQVWLGWALP